MSTRRAVRVAKKSYTPDDMDSAHYCGAYHIVKGVIAQMSAGASAPMVVAALREHLQMTQAVMQEIIKSYGLTEKPDYYGFAIGALVSCEECLRKAYLQEVAIRCKTDKIERLERGVCKAPIKKGGKRAKAKKVG